MFFFDKKNFMRDLDKVRNRKKISWNKLAVRAGVHPSTLNKFVREIDDEASLGISLETFISLLGWMKQMDVTDYVKPED